MPRPVYSMRLLLLGLAGLAAVMPPPTPRVMARSVTSNAWDELASWLVDPRPSLSDAAGFAKPGLSLTPTEHAGASIRGLLTTSRVATGEQLLRIPHTKCFSPRSGNLSSLPPFNGEPPSLSCLPQRSILAGAVMLAYEMERLPPSRFAPYFRMFPTVAQYERYLPSRAPIEALRGFSALPLVNHSGYATLAARDRHKRCFDQLPSIPLGHDKGAPLLHWEAVDRALVIIKTRAYSHTKSADRLCVADLANTEVERKLNTKWSFNSKDEFVLVSSKPIEAGDEIYEPYCSYCANNMMLWRWGVYFEDNLNLIPKRRHPNGVDCSKLRGVTEGILDLEREASALASKWTSPRCRHAAILDSPVRCLLARLSWETCAHRWDRPQWAAAREQRVLAVTGIPVSEWDTEYFNRRSVRRKRKNAQGARDHRNRIGK